MLKFFGIVGLAGVSLTTYLVTYGVGPEQQLPPEVSLLEGFREEGAMPESRNLEEDERAEEGGAFEVPPKDEEVLEAALEAMGDMDMGGMDMSAADTGMGNMDMSGANDTAMADTDMSGGGDMSGMDMTAADTAMGGMDMSGTDDTAMAGMDMSGTGEEAVLDMDMDGDGVMDMSSAAMGGMDMSGTDGTAMAATDGAAMDGMAMSPSNAAMMGEGGLLITEDGAFDREIELTMQEWGYSDMQIDVRMGERIKFTVKNGGEIPHEFMFMTMPLMAAANYRATRADWNLLEHEALFERALVLPGGDFEFVVQVQQAGSWMFMCMLPYHMQMGMMGQMSTEGMTMDMGMQ